MALLDMIKRQKSSGAAEQKMAAPSGYVWLYSGGGLSDWLDGDPAMTNLQAWQSNPIAFRCVSLVSQAAASIKLQLIASGAARDEALKHPAAALLARPNPDCAGSAFFEALYSQLFLYGNGFVQLLQGSTGPAQLHLLRPDLMQIETNKRGRVASYLYGHGEQQNRFERVDDTPFELFHCKFFHPENPHWGHSPMQTALVAVEIHNQGAKWNNALISNAARPSGALVFNGGEGAERLSAEQFERLTNQLDDVHSGPANAGRPLLLEGGLNWTPMSLSPTEMDFIEARREAAREIALCFGVPPMLLGIPGDNTYANFKEANLAFWKQTILPLARRVTDSLSAWLGDFYERDFRLQLDLDDLPALSTERETLWRRLNDTDFLTRNEKRQLAGFAALPPENSYALTEQGHD